MTMHMAGWVEILKPSDAPAWSPAINVSGVVWSGDSGLQQFFMAQERGLPGDVTAQVQHDIESYRVAGAGILEESWCAWSELEPFAHAHDLDEDVRTLFALAETLASRFGNRNVRFVVWFFV